MAYTLSFSADMIGAGLTLNAKLFDAVGAQSGATIESGIVEVMSKVYSYTVTLPDGFVGTFVMYDPADTEDRAVFSVNPQEAENTDAKTSTRATPAQVNSEVDTALADVGLTTTITGRIDVAVSSRAAQTSVAALTATATVAGQLPIVHATTLEATVTGLTISASWIAFDFSLKHSNDDSDNDAVLRIRVSNPAGGDDGLQWFNRAAASDKTQAGLTVNQAAGTVAILIEDDATRWLNVGDYVWDCKEFKTVSKSYQRASGTCLVTYPTNRLIA